MSFFNDLSINWLDIIIIAFAAWFGYKGLRNGLIKELVSIIALVAGIWGTVKFSDLVASWMGDSQLIKIAAFVVTFIVVLILVHLVGKIIEEIVTLIIPSFINKFFGFLFGVGKIALIFSVLFYFFSLVDAKEKLLSKDIKEESLIYKYVEPLFPYGKDKIATWQEPSLLEAMQ